MRLIDADALLEQYNLKDCTKYGNKNAEQQRHSYDTLMMYEIADMIENAPTVFSVEGVIANMEKEKFELPDCRYDVDLNSTIDEMIEIVKAGGLNE